MLEEAKKYRIKDKLLYCNNSLEISLQLQIGNNGSIILPYVEELKDNSFALGYDGEGNLKYMINLKNSDIKKSEFFEEDFFEEEDLDILIYSIMERMKKDN